MPAATDACHATGLAVLLLATAPAGAAGRIEPVAVAQYERAVTDSPLTGTSFRNNLLRFAAGFDSEYTAADQRLYLNALYGNVSNGPDIDFGNDEYVLSTGLAWQFRRSLSGLLEASGYKQAPSVPDVFILGTSILEERRLTGAVAWLLADRLRLAGSAVSRNLETPILGFPELGLRETIYDGTAVYQTRGYLAWGGYAEDIDGRFRGAPDLPGYEQQTAGGSIDYVVPRKYALRARLGRSEREQEGEPEPFEETTGRGTVEWTLTGKTALNAQVSRRLDNYFGPDAGAFATISTWNAGINWRATTSATVYLDYGQTRTEFLGDGIIGQIVTGRLDRASSINLNVKSEAIPWLTTEIYARIDDVTSNFPIYSFDGLFVGLKLVARPPRPGPLASEDR